MKNQKNKKTHVNTPNRELWIARLKIAAMTASMIGLICNSVIAADLEIYKVPEASTGTTTLMLMLDMSGSMKYGMNTSSNATAGNQRLDILKQGLRDVLQGTATTDPVDDKVVLGLATFAGDNGYIRIPAKALGEETGGADIEIRKILWEYQDRVLTNNDYRACEDWNLDWSCKRWGSWGRSSIIGSYDGRYDQGSSRYYYNVVKRRKETHRDVLLAEINNNLNANGGTPTPYAYAEAAAYLMGTNTTPVVPSYFVRSSDRKYASCNGWSSNNTCNSWVSSRGNITWSSGSIPSGYTQGDSGIVAGSNGYYYIGAKPNTYSGFNTSATYSGVTSGHHYAMPASIQEQIGDTPEARAKKECSGQGIYFLTDGEPWVDSDAIESMMQTTLDTKGNNFNCAASPLGQNAPYTNVDAKVWQCIGNYAKTLLDPEKNPVGLKIKTAVVGFSSGFSTNGNADVEDAKTWGTIGEGKWYVGTNSSSVVESINNFINELNKEIPSLSTGASTIPKDALNPEIIQPYAYFPQLEPKVDPVETQQLWFGNVKKYYVVNNGVYSNENGGAANTVVLKSKLQDLQDAWAKSGITYPENTPIYQKGGALSQLILGRETRNGTDGKPFTVERKIISDYIYDNGDISRDFNLKQISSSYTTDTKTKTDDASRVRGLMALLGYNITNGTNTNGLDLSSTTATLRQMGSVYHSLPVLLTQEGKTQAKEIVDADGKSKVIIESTGREDYVMFGTTQGLLSVVDAKYGTEKFSFVPKEMIEKQSETFKENAGSLAGGKNALYYGMDGEWAAHTVYVSKSDGTLTVKGIVRDVLGSKTDKENLEGKQWVYGGMRMGGRSYYALDLTDIENPKLKFHIDPNTGKVYSAAHPAGESFPEIENMGQSWSKPKLDYVNWKGQRKLVMFVGGGYDAGGSNGDGLWADGKRIGYQGYEQYNYEQDNKRGSGVYMFDANTGDLLWYANTPADIDGEEPTSTPESGGTSTVEAIPHITHDDLKYSVVSEIKTVDRDNDGMVDHLYFGDLGGQAFRVDFARNKDKFNSQITKILDLHQTDGASPRFYLPPTFTAHHSAFRKEGTNIVVASFISGNQSSPLMATEDSPDTTYTTGKRSSTGLQYDGVYAIYDYEIHPNGVFYPDEHVAARTLAETTDVTPATNKLKYISHNSIVRSDADDDTQVTGAFADKDNGWGGWYYRFDHNLDADDKSESVVKGLAPLIAMEGSLYVTMYDASDDGTSSDCGAGVKGKSFVQRLCLPTGVCAEDANYSYNLGAGIVSLQVGPVSGGVKSIVVPDPEDIGTGCSGDDCVDGKNFIFAGGEIRFIPNRWYERYAKK